MNSTINANNSPLRNADLLANAPPGAQTVADLPAAAQRRPAGAAALGSLTPRGRAAGSLPMPTTPTTPASRPTSLQRAPVSPPAPSVLPTPLGDVDVAKLGLNIAGLARPSSSNATTYAAPPSSLRVTGLRVYPENIVTGDGAYARGVVNGNLRLAADTSLSAKVPVNVTAQGVNVNVPTLSFTSQVGEETVLQLNTNARQPVRGLTGSVTTAVGESAYLRFGYGALPAAVATPGEVGVTIGLGRRF
jgi:hypothetical protein